MNYRKQRLTSSLLLDPQKVKVPFLHLTLGPLLDHQRGRSLRLPSLMIVSKRDGRYVRYEPSNHIGFRYQRPRVLTRTGIIFVIDP